MIFLWCGTGYFGRGLVLPRYLVLHRDKFSHKKEAPENSSHLVTLTLMTEQLVQKQMPNHRIPTPKLLLSTTFLCTLSHFGQKYVSYLQYYLNQINGCSLYVRALSDKIQTVRIPDNFLPGRRTFNTRKTQERN